MSTLKKKTGRKRAQREGGNADDAAGRMVADRAQPAPLSLWRTLRAEQFRAEDLDAILRILSNTELLGQQKWSEAITGDVPATVAVAVSFMPVQSVTPQVDLAMSALARCAIEGDLAAAIVLANILRHLPGVTVSHRRIATSWFVSNLAFARTSAELRRKLPYRGRPLKGKRPPLGPTPRSRS